MALFPGLPALAPVRRRKAFGHSKVKYSAALRVGSYVGGMVLYLLGILGSCILLGERKKVAVGPLAVYCLFECGPQARLPSMPWME